MDSFNFSSGFSTPSYNVNSWGNVTNNFGQSIGNVDRYSSFQSNLNFNRYNVDSYGIVSNGFNRLGTPICNLNGYNDYTRMQRTRDDMSYLKMKEDNDYLFGKFNRHHKEELFIPKIDPVILPELKYSFKAPASAPLFPDYSYKKKSRFEEDLPWKYKF